MARLTDDSFIAAYMMASGRNGTIYIGSSSDLPARVAQHRLKTFKGFTAEHGCGGLVWYERHTFITDAIRRERALKRWNRKWKLELIESTSPEWRDLAEDWWN